MRHSLSHALIKLFFLNCGKESHSLRGMGEHKNVHENHQSGVRGTPTSTGVSPGYTRFCRYSSEENF